MLFKLETRLRRLVWRASNPIYGVFISSTVLSFFAMKAFASSYGPADTHRRRLEADGTYAKRRFAEVNDSERRLRGERRRVGAARAPPGRTATPPPTTTTTLPMMLRRGTCTSAQLPSAPARVLLTTTHIAPQRLSHHTDPLYRLPENAVGGHRLDGMSPQQHRGAALQHH